MSEYLSGLIAAHRRNDFPHMFSLAALQVACDRQVFDPSLAESSRLFAEVILGLDLDGQFVVDAGCGSGVLGICAKIAGAGRVLSFDCNPKAVKSTLCNVRTSGVTEVDAVLSDQLPVRSRSVDMILFNPPFFDRQVNDPWHRAFCDPNHEFFWHVLRRGSSVLKPTGCLLLACGGDLSEEYVDLEVRCNRWRARLLGQSTGELQVRILSLERCQSID